MIKTTLRTITGLHIGGSDDTMHIGGIDSSVIKREIYSNDDGTINYDGTGKKIWEPYIPGSSIKGKVRSLLEHHFGLIKIQQDILKEKAGKPIDSNFIKKIDDKLLQQKGKLIIKLFGESAGDNNTNENKVTRAIFRDVFLTTESRKLYIENKIKLSEEKAENTINRVLVTASPRFMERVPAGIEFDFEVILRKFEEDKNLPLLKTLELGLKLLQNDTLGGGGSRGNGKIEFKIYKDENIQENIKNLTESINEALKNETN